MMTQDFLLQLVFADPERDAEWATATANILQSPDTRIGDSYPGISSAKDVLATLHVHKKTTEANKIRTVGLEETIGRLEAVRPETRLLVFGLFAAGQSALIHISMSAKTIDLVGCVVLEGKVRALGSDPNSGH